MKSTGYDPYYRFGAALVASAIKAARKIEGPGTRETYVAAMTAIAWLARPAASNEWFEMAGFEHDALVGRLPLDRWVERGRALMLSDPDLLRALT